MPLPHIVVLGAGFGGLSFAKEFPGDLARITLVDRQNHHLFQPLLYQVASSGLAAPDIAQPIRSILRKKPNLVVLLADVTGIDLAARRVQLADGTLDYDYLVLALGSHTSYFGHNEWERFAPGLKTLDDAMRLRRNTLLAYEKAEREPDPQRRQELMTTVVIGGGPTGVELAGSFAELARTVLYRDFDHIDPRQARIILVEGSPRLLGTFPEDLSASAKQQIEGLGVEVRLATRVTAIREGEVEIGSEVIRAGNIVWAAGVAAVPVTQSGIQSGGHVAKVIARELKEGPKAVRTAFTYWDKGNMATIGRTHAVAQIGKLHLTNFSAWLSWLALHLFFLIGLRNRISVLVQWTYSYFTYRRGARIIMGLGDTPPPK